MDGAMPIFTELLSGKISQNINDDLEQCQLLADPAQKSRFLPVKRHQVQKRRRICRRSILCSAMP